MTPSRQYAIENLPGEVVAAGTLAILTHLSPL